MRLRSIYLVGTSFIARSLSWTLTFGAMSCVNSLLVVCRCLRLLGAAEARLSTSRMVPTVCTTGLRLLGPRLRRGISAPTIVLSCRSKLPPSSDTVVFHSPVSSCAYMACSSGGRVVGRLYRWQTPPSGGKILCSVQLPQTSPSRWLPVVFGRRRT